MIDVTSEELLSLNEARNRLPKRRQGKRPDVSTLYRWGLRGCKGVRLETVQIGGTRCTSTEALARFFARLSSLPPADAGNPAATPAIVPSTLDGANAAMPEGWFPWERRKGPQDLFWESIHPQWRGGLNPHLCVRVPDTGDPVHDLYALALACVRAEESTVVRVAREKRKK